MGLIQSQPVSGKIMLWLLSGFVAGVALMNYFQLKAVSSYEEDNSVTCGKPTTSNSTMRNINAGFFWFFFALFLVFSFYLFFPTTTATKVQTGLAKPQSLSSAVAAWT